MPLIAQSSRRAPVRAVVAALVAVLLLVAGVFTATSPATAASSESSLFDQSAVTASTDSDTAGVELGVRFVPRVDGSVVSVRFYQREANTGAHTGSLWTGSGAQLASATFTDSAASGWHSVTFATAVAVRAGQTYVASYFAPHARYVATTGFFARPYARGDLSVPANGGVYRYGSTSVFPDSTYDATNYYVDLVFRPATGSTAPTPTPTVTPSPTATPTPTPTAPPSSFRPGNQSGTVAVPAGAGIENVSNPTTVVGTGTASSCTSAAVVSAVATGGVVTFNCGPSPVTIRLSQTLKVKNSTRQLVIDGGGKVTLSGGKSNRILYIDTCDTSLGSVSGNCLYAPDYPRVSVQNITLADGNATNASYVSPGDSSGGSNGGGAIFALGGHLKVVRSVFTGNTCASTGADLGGGAIRVLAQHSATPNSYDNSYAARNQDPALIVQSTFGGADGLGNSCSNGGAVSTLRTPATIINSLLTYNNAVGCCSNPAQSGTPGGGSGGATYSDGDSYDLTIRGTYIERNTAKAGGSAIFLVSNDNTGHLVIDSSTSRNNTYTTYNGRDRHFQNYPGIFYLGSGAPRITNSTVQ